MSQLVKFSELEIGATFKARRKGHDVYRKTGEYEYIVVKVFVGYTGPMSRTFTSNEAATINIYPIKYVSPQEQFRNLCKNL